MVVQTPVTTMKKMRLFTTVAVLIAAGTLQGQQRPLKVQSPRPVVQTAQSPRHVYLYEDFSTPGTYLDTTQWDIVTDTSYKFLYYTAFANAGGLPPEALWAYAPSSGMNRRMSGTYRLVSKPHAVPADERAYVAVSYDYYGNVTSAEGVRSFGLSARKAGGEWMPCRTVGITKSTSAPARLVAELPAECRGAQDVQVSVDFQTQIDKAYYTLYFDDIEFFSYPEQHSGLTFSWQGRPYTANRIDTLITADTTVTADTTLITADTLVTVDTLAVALLLGNTGNALTSCKITYRFDGGSPHTLSLTFKDKLMPGQADTVWHFKPVGWETAGPGHHTVEFWLAEADGQAIPESALVKQVKTLTILDERIETFPYRPLVEEFSSSSCNSCKPRNEILKRVFDSIGDRISVVKYQVYWPGKGDPYYVEDAGIRTLFYDVHNAPDIYLNGRHDVGGASAVGYQARFSAKIGAASWFNITCDTLALDADTNLYVVCNLRSSVAMDGLRLHTVVLEKQTEGNASTNHETEFHHVMLKMLPDGTGLPVSLKPDTVYTFRYRYDMKKTFMEESDDLQVVCFLQAANDSVMQSACGDVTMRIDRIPVATEPVLAYEKLAVYPNPASEYVLIPGLEHATLEIFDHVGRRVLHRTAVTGDYRWEVGSVRPGLYIIRAQSGHRVAYAKVSVVG